MSYSLKDLRSVPTEELIAMHDKLASWTQPSVSYCLGEIKRRDDEKTNAEMLEISRQMRRHSRWITAMTVVITVATIANLLLFLFRSS